MKSSVFLKAIDVSNDHGVTHWQGGIVVGETMLYTANPVLAGLAYGGTSTLIGQGLEKATGRKLHILFQWKPENKDGQKWRYNNLYLRFTWKSYTYNYDAAHNMTSKVDGKGTTSYTYDTLNRLLTVTEPDNKTTTYAFDTAGNRTSESVVAGSNTTVTTYSYNTQNRLTGTTSKLNNVIIETRAYSYDNNGNELTVTKTPYLSGVAQTPQVVLTNIYDKLNQLITSVTSDGKSIINTYNGEGYRVEKSVNGQVTRYLYEYDKVVLETDGAGNQKARNVYGINLLMRDTSGEQYFYMYNAHADVTALLKPDGTIAGTYYYDAFGNIIEQTGTADNSINYAGYQYDKDTGLYYLNARMYDPKIARFLQEDTYLGDLNDPLSLNRYAYGKNNPMMYYDPTGHFNVLSSEFWKGVGKKANEVADAVLSFEGAFLGEACNNLVYKPTYTVTKVLGSDDTAESYKKDTEEAMGFFYSWGSNKTAKEIGGMDGSLFGQGLQMALFGSVGKALGFVSKLLPIDQHIMLNFASASATTYINGYADGYRGKELIHNSAEAGWMVSAGGYAFDTLAPKLSSIFDSAKKSKNSFAVEMTGNVKGGNNPYDLLNKRGIPTTLGDAEIDAANAGYLRMQAKGGSQAIKDLYRAVGPEEFDDIFATNSFRQNPNGNSYAAKQFGVDFDETLNLANQPIMKDTAAIVKVTVPENVYKQLNLMELDRYFLKSGSATVEPEMLDMFNKSILNIQHVY